MESNFNLPKNGKERIVIIGAGFAGLKLARSLAGSKYQVVLLDRRNYHMFQPLFYQVATSGIEPSSISFPVRKIFQKHSNLHFRNTELLEVNQQNKVVVTANGTLRYDYLVIATGAITNYFGNKNVEQNSFPMKNTAQAIRMRNRLLESFEKAILTENKDEHNKLMSVAVVGGGPTGVELSGAIAEMKNYVLPKDYPELDFSRMRIVLYEAGPRLLNGMREKSGEDAVRYLQKLGVEVKLNRRIENYDGENISLSNGKAEQISNLFWAAGVSGKKINGIQEESYARGNRLVVDEHNRVKGSDSIFAIGDICLMQTKEYPNGHPQVAQVAIQQAQILSKNLRSEKWKPFHYKDKGSMATVGRNMAVVDLPAFRFSGYFAWVLWLFIHLMAIVGVKNRLFILLNWAQSYIWRDQSLRVLIQPYRKMFAKEKETV